jgi:NADH dehydrogenase
MRARIYKPSKTAMSSGLAKTKSWVLEFIQETTSEIDPLMGWTSSGDTQSQVTLKFGSEQAAIDYAREHGIDAQIFEPKQRKFNVRSGGYGENFATNRRGAWTH